MSSAVDLYAHHLAVQRHAIRHIRVGGPGLRGSYHSADGDVGYLYGGGARFALARVLALRAVQLVDLDGRAHVLQLDVLEAHVPHRPVPALQRRQSCESSREGFHFISGWEVAHAAGSPRPPIPLPTIVARTEGYTYDASVWDLSLVVRQSFAFTVERAHRFQHLYVVSSLNDIAAPPPARLLAYLRTDNSPQRKEA
jgi:hypothetical protein